MKTIRQTILWFLLGAALAVASAPIAHAAHAASETCRVR